MTIQEATKLIKDLYYDEDYFRIPKLAEAFEMAIDALKLKEELMQEIPNFIEVMWDNFEIFKRYNVNDHTEIEQIAFDNFDKTVQHLQWLIDRLE